MDLFKWETKRETVFLYSEQLLQVQDLQQSLSDIPQTEDDRSQSAPTSPCDPGGQTSDHSLKLCSKSEQTNKPFMTHFVFVQMWRSWRTSGKLCPLITVVRSTEPTLSLPIRLLPLSYVTPVREKTMETQWQKERTTRTERSEVKVLQRPRGWTYTTLCSLKFWGKEASERWDATHTPDRDPLWFWPPLVSWPGDAGRAEGHWRGLRSQGAEERRDPAGWWRGLHHDGETDPRLGQEASVPDATLLLLPD